MKGDIRWKYYQGAESLGGEVRDSKVDQNMSKTTWGKEKRTGTTFDWFEI